MLVKEIKINVDAAPNKGVSHETNLAFDGMHGQF